MGRWSLTGAAADFRLRGSWRLYWGPTMASRLSTANLVATLHLEMFAVLVPLLLAAEYGVVLATSMITLAALVALGPAAGSIAAGLLAFSASSRHPA